MNGDKLYIELTKDQINDFLNLLDTSLKLNGLQVLTKTVELYNALLSASLVSSVAQKKKYDDDGPI